MAAACSAPDNSVDRAGDAYMPPYDADRQPIPNALKTLARSSYAPCPAHHSVRRKLQGRTGFSPMSLG